MDADFSEVLKLSADLGKASGAVHREAEKVVKRGAHNVKDTMVADAKSNGHYKHFHRSISYDRTTRLGEIAYEVGPDKGRVQGALGNILYFGTSNNAPVLNIESGLKAEAPEFERRMALLAEGLLDE